MTDQKKIEPATEKPAAETPATPAPAGHAEQARKGKAVLKDLDAGQTPSGGSCGSNPNLAMSHLVGD